MRHWATNTPWIQHPTRLAWAAMKTITDSISQRRLVVTRWSPREKRWHYRWPEGRVRDPGRWADAAGWATQGYYYGLADLLWRRYRPKEGDIVLDLGAGHGGETLYLAKMVGPSGRVLSIEAFPETFRRLQELCSLNGWPHVEPIMAAVGADVGTAQMAPGSSWVAGNIYEGGEINVPATTIDALCAARGITHIDWLKMNIEGSEKLALQGMEVMASHVSHMTISCHDFLGTEWGRTLDFVMSWLRDHGFEVQQRDEGDMVQRLYVYAWKDSGDTRSS